ncbi:glycosyltransferase [Flavobacteriaceae bacterium F89]|uniref:Glycosyltransferase n=1 Tax=Cerina litoralis TaxID=2874477 RepID=A0AAE3EVK4_9FLAO|nr:glycosyltransferase [Cerina litoralis]MCG2461104.1 glycosyltransferase [Cerina litoralis]
MDLSFSFIVPVYNRPNEIRELLDSFLAQDYGEGYEIVIVEDGSTLDSEGEIQSFSDLLNVTYLRKANSGPGDSRNYGMSHAKGNYFIVLDSDCILPSHYLSTVATSLEREFVHCFGGPDAAHPSFSNVQKAINYAMTAMLTTGGIRGRKSAVGKFQPRSFNMGISKNAFEKTKGFGNIHPGEDPDLTFRIWNAGFKTRLIPEAFVYHKRRIDWKQFMIQVKKFGMVRPILNVWHPKTARLTYWVPTIFCVGFLFSCFFWFFGRDLRSGWPLMCYLIYFFLIFVDSFFKNKNVTVAVLSIVAVVIQFSGYGYGFLKSNIILNYSKKNIQDLFPKLFFRSNL